MPCIKVPADCNKTYSRALCGKMVSWQQKPFNNPELALKSGNSICPACRKAAGLPPKSPKTKQESPYSLYVISRAEIQTYTIVKQTATGYRTDDGEFIYDDRKSSGEWRLAGGEASKYVLTRDKTEALAEAKKQLDAFDNYVLSLAEKANAIRGTLKKLELHS